MAATSITVFQGGPGPAGPPGPQGPPGPAGSGEGGPVTYTHTQITPTTVWDITHNLGYNPGGIRVEGSDGVTYWPDVEYQTVNTIRLLLPESINGTAYIS